MKTWGGLVGLALIGLVYSCGGGDDPYAELRDSSLLSRLPPDATLLEMECRKVEQFAATDYYACSQNYATDFDLSDIRDFHLGLLSELGYEVSLDGPQYVRSNRHMILASSGDLGASIRIRDAFTNVPESEARRWTVVVEVTRPD